MLEQLEDGTMYVEHLSPLAWMFWPIYGANSFPNIYGIYDKRIPQRRKSGKGKMNQE